MNYQNIVKMIVFAIVGIIMVSAIVVPIVDTGTDDLKSTRYNIGQRAELVKEDHTMSYDLSSTFPTATIDGEEVTFTTGSVGIFSDVFYAYLSSGYANLFFLDGNSWKFVGQVLTFDVNVDADNKTITVSDVAYSSSATITTFTGGTASYKLCAIPDVQGDLTMMVAPSTTSIAYVPSVDSVIGILTKSGASYGFVDGTNPIVVDGVEESEPTIVVNDTGYDGLLTLDIQTTTPSVYYEDYKPNVFLLPYMVTGYVEMGQTTSTILVILPVLVIIGICVTVAYQIGRRN